MDLMDFVLFIGLIGIGIAIGLAVGYVLGRRAIWNEIEDYLPLADEDGVPPVLITPFHKRFGKNDALNAEFIEEKRKI